MYLIATHERSNVSDLNGQKPHVSSSSTREKLRPTVGESAIKAAEQTSPSRNPIELEREMHKDYEQNIYESIQKGRSIFPNSFYIKVITKRERLLTNVIRNYFVLVVACPSPDWDQTIYYYDRPKETLSLLWVIPCRDACKYLIEHANEV